VEINGYRLIVGWPTVLSALIILALLAYALRDPWLRSWRTVLAAILAIFVIAAALLVPVDVRAIIRGAVIGLYAVAVVFADRRLWSLRRSDGEFAIAFRTTQAKWLTLARQIDSIPRAEYTPQFAAIIDELTQLAPPSDDWGQARDDVVTELSRRLTRVRLEVPPTEDDFRLADQRWDAAQAALRHLFDARRSFWLPWP
jgi:hypothetical protein